MMKLLNSIQYPKNRWKASLIWIFVSSRRQIYSAFRYLLFTLSVSSDFYWLSCFFPIDFVSLENTFSLCLAALRDQLKKYYPFGFLPIVKQVHFWTKLSLSCIFPHSKLAQTFQLIRTHFIYWMMILNHRKLPACI